jgi:hypothetical protein
MSRVIEELAGDWRHLDARIENLLGEIETLARQDQHCERLMTNQGVRSSSRSIGTAPLVCFRENSENDAIARSILFGPRSRFSGVIAGSVRAS